MVDTNHLREVLNPQSSNTPLHRVFYQNEKKAAIKIFIDSTKISLIMIIL